MGNDVWRLNRLTLRNYRRFPALTVSFDDRMTVLVGDNGAGKTSVLDAAAVAIGALLRHVDNPYAPIYNTKLLRSDMRLKEVDTGGSLASREPQPVDVGADGIASGADTAWSLSLSKPNGRTSLKDATDAVSVSDHISEVITSGLAETLPLFAYYGSGRLWMHKREKRNSGSLYAKGFSRSSGYVDCLDAATNEKMLLSWFERMTLTELQRGCRMPELDAVRMAVAECFKDLIVGSEVSVYYDVGSYGLVVDGLVDDEGVQQGPLPFENLSDGYRGALSLIMDIAYRMAVLNPGACRILSTPGIVLIDEIDLHLHPLWQERILKDLTTIFPCVQGIVTTHAPTVIASVPARQIRRIRRSSDDAGEYVAEQPGSETYGHDAGSILEDIMGAHSRQQSVIGQYRRFYDALDDGRLEDAQRLLEELRETVGDDSGIAGAQVALDLARMDDDDATD